MRRLEVDAPWGCWAAGDTAGSWCFLEKRAPGGRGEGKGRHKKKAREGMCQEGPVSGLAGAGGGSLPEGPSGARQQGALMRKSGKGSVISGVLPFSIPGPSLRLLKLGQV